MLFSIVVHVKGLQNEKAQRELLSLPLLLHGLKHLVWSRAFTSVTYVSHCATGFI